MSDTQVDQGINTEALPLPEREITQMVSRKAVYSAGDVNTFTFVVDGQEHTGYFKFDRARLISVSGRIQQTQRTRALVVTQGIVIDNPEIGVFEGDVMHPHPLHVDPRYTHWQNLPLPRKNSDGSMRPGRPYRINAQQWVQPENRNLVQDYVNYLHNRFGFSIIQRPQPRQGSQRKTRDLFVARPSNGLRALENPDSTDFGANLNAFEISTNPDYEQGFNSFYEGLEEQRARWEAAFQIEDEDLRNQHLEQIAQNINFIGGVYRDEDARTWWARPVDVGMVEITDPESGESRNWPLYQQFGSELSEDLFEALDEPTTTDQSAAPSGMSVDALTIPDQDEEDDF